MTSKSFTALLVLLGVLLCCRAISLPLEEHLNIRDDELSNAERFARGLGPKQPKRLYDPSRTGAPLARRSASPNVFVKLLAKDVNGNNVGYMYIDRNRVICGLTQDILSSDDYSPQGEGDLQYLYYWSQQYQHNMWLGMHAEYGTMGSPDFAGTITGSYSQMGAYTNIWDTPTGYPGPLIPDSTAYGGGPLNVYWQRPGQFTSSGGALWASLSAATVNAGYGSTIVQESDLVTLSFLSP